MRRVLAIGTPLAIGAGAIGAYHRIERRHNAAFCEMMWQLWENPDRDRSVRPWDDENITRLQEYMDASTWHLLTTPPPVRDEARWDKIDSIDYSDHCLSIAHRELEALIEQEMANEQKADTRECI